MNSTSREWRTVDEVPEAEGAELRRRYDAGATLRKLLDDGFDGSYRLLCAVLRREGVTFRPSEPIKQPAPQGMVDTYLSGKSIIETGQKYGYGRDATKRMLIDAGVTIRERGRPRERATSKSVCSHHPEIVTEI